MIIVWLAGEVEQVPEGAPQAQARLGQPDGMHVRAHEAAFIGQIQPRRRESPDIIASR